MAASGAVSGSVSGLQRHLDEVGLPHTVARVVWVSRAVDLQVAAAERRRLGLPGCGSLQQPRQPADPCCPTTRFSPMYGRWSRWWMPARMVAASTALAAGWLQVVLERGAACIEVFVGFKSTVSLSTALSPVGPRVRSQ